MATALMFITGKFMKKQDRKFLKKYFQELLTIGIPLKTLEEDGGWDYLLDHSDCMYTQWDSKSLEYNQMVRLIEIIHEYGESSNDLTNALRKRLALIEQQLTLLNYSNKWMAYELLKKDSLTEQVNEYKKGDDTNTEHYRYKSFLRFMEENDSFNDKQIDNFLELITIDQDQTMAGSVMVKMLRKPSLTPTQFELLVERFRHFGKWTEKTITNEIKRRTGDNA